METSNNNEYNLNIIDYSISEILNFFNIPEDYDKQTLIENVSTISSAIFTDKKISPNFKKQFQEFSIQAINILEKELTNSHISQQNNNLIITPAPPSLTTGTRNHPIPPILNSENYTTPNYTFNTDVAKGTLNKLQKRTIKRLMNFNSLYQVAPIGDSKNTNSNYYFNCPYQLKEVVSTKLVSLTIPQNSIYQFNTANKSNCFYIIEDITNAEGLVLIPEGNYPNTTNLEIAIQTAINTKLLSANFIVSIDPTTFKTSILNLVNTFTIYFGNNYEQNDNKCLPPLQPPHKTSSKIEDSNKPNRSCNLEDFNSNLYKNCGYILGYRMAVYKGEKIYSSEGNYNNGYYNSIFLSLNEYSMGFSTDLILILNDSYYDNNIIGKIEYNNLTPANSSNILIKREYFGPVNINKMEIQLLNQYGDIVNLNKMNFEFILEFELIYDI